jgi:hypothetical protein
MVTDLTISEERMWNEASLRAEREGEERSRVQGSPTNSIYNERQDQLQE